jgi:3-oxoacyl-[acyl-carrier protein] reductase
MKNLEGKAGIVTGAGRGIGRAIALLMAEQGASVIVNDLGAGREAQLEKDDSAEQVVQEIVKAGGKATANRDSVADYQAAGRMVRTCAETYGKIDFVVNTAGMLRERMIWNMTEEDFDLVIGVHLKGTWNMCTHATKMMRNQRFGRIVNFSSDAFKGSVGQCNYAAAKAGIIGLTRTIAREAGQYGITANAMCPFAATRMTVNDAVIANWKRRVENGLMTQKDFEQRMAMPGPEYIAPMVAYLCTDAAKDVNGQIFHAEKGHYHTYYYGEVKRSVFKHEDGGMFNVDELIDIVPTTLMYGIPNEAPAKEPKEG